MSSDAELAALPVHCHALAFAPSLHDAPVLAGLLQADGVACRVCTSFHELLELLDDDCLLVLMTEEAFTQCDTRTLLDTLAAQPSWSDIPIIGLIGGSGVPRSGERLASLSQIGNITLLDRPVSAEALMMLVRTALRARRLQYKVRDQLHQLAEHSEELERRVDARTAALAREVEERKRVEAALNESRRLESLGRLTGGIAHDFNNLLQVISGGVEVIRVLTGTHADSRLERALERISRSSKNGAKLTQQLLAYARHQPLVNSSIDLAAHIASLADLLRHSLGRAFQLTIEVEPEMCPIRADLTQLDVAILNLVFNARDAMPDGGAVTLSVSTRRLPDPEWPEISGAEGRFVCIALSDEGSGIDADIAGRVFEPFFTTKPLGKGTGLGLSQVQGFAMQSGGQSFVRQQERGVTVGFVLPCADGDRVPDEVSAPMPAVALAGLRVLCIEDHYDVMGVAIAILENLGLNVTALASADDAKDVDLSAIDLVFSDVMMPGQMDGIDFAHAVRRDYPDMPIVLASGYVLDPRRLAELKVTFLQKPYTADAVQAAFAEEITRRGRPGGWPAGGGT